MEPLPELAEPLDHTSFDRGVHVLVRGVEGERPARDLLTDLAHPVLERLRVRSLEELRRLQRADVRDGRLDVLRRQTDVEREGLRQPVRARVGRLGEAPAPERPSHGCCAVRPRP